MNNSDITAITTKPNQHILLIGSVILLIMAAFVAGLVLSDKISLQPNNNQPTASVKPQSSPEESIFDSENATITGIITKVDQNIVTLRSTTAKFREEQSFPLSADFRTYRYSSGKPQASISAEIKSISTQQETIISLIKEGSQYKINGITYYANTPKN